PLEQLPQLVRHQPLNNPRHDQQPTQPNEMTSKETLGEKGRSDAVKKANVSRGEEGRREAAQKGRKKLGEKGLSDAYKKRMDTMGAEARSEAVRKGHEKRRLKRAAGAGLSAVEVPASGRDSFSQGSASVSRSSGGAGSSSASGGVQSGGVMSGVAAYASLPAIRDVPAGGPQQDGVMSGVAAAVRVSLPSIRDVPGLREELEAGVPGGSRRAYRPPSPPQAGGMRR
ncbi:hypothetical protein, partial [Streptomyces sp. NPDC049744]|uniref:hypothetical protein n=1 Tax=Streptomyces sp. NPDC049744 TaxID=3154359 RepID=UPI00341A2FC3